MFDIGFLELLICGIIGLLVLGPERLPRAARTAGKWAGQARRMVQNFSRELDRELEAEEFREELRKAGDIGLDDVKRNVNEGLAEARKYESYIMNREEQPVRKASTEHTPDSSTRSSPPERSQ